MVEGSSWEQLAKSNNARRQRTALSGLLERLRPRRANRADSNTTAVELSFNC